MSNTTKRERLIDAAAELFYHKGITTTSLADIANKAVIPIGNVYYYFKTKEDLALSVIEKRRSLLNNAYEMLNKHFDDPRERLVQALSFFENIKSEYTEFGCPLGRLIAELNVSEDGTAQEAAKVLNEFVDWAAKQFKALGHDDRAKEYAISLMAGIQGAAIMAKSIGKSQIFVVEIKRLTRWVQELPNHRFVPGKIGKI